MSDSERTPPPKSTRLTIEGYKDGGRNILVGRNSDPSVSYYTPSNLSNTKSIEICTQKGVPGKPVQLPEDMLEGITRYFQTYEQGARTKDADCTVFAYFANSVFFWNPKASRLAHEPAR